MPLLAEVQLSRVSVLTYAFASYMAACTDARCGLEARLGRPLSGPERAHLADSLALCDAQHALLAQAQAALITSRADAGAAAHLHTAAAVCDHIASCVAAWIAVSRARVIEFQRRRAAHGTEEYWKHVMALAPAMGVDLSVLQPLLGGSTSATFFKPEPPPA